MKKHLYLLTALASSECCRYGIHFLLVKLELNIVHRIGGICFMVLDTPLAFSKNDVPCPYISSTTFVSTSSILHMYHIKILLY